MRTVMVIAFLFGVAVPVPAQTDDAVGIVFVREKGVGSVAQAQPYVDKLGTLIAPKMRWSGAKLSYFTTRDGALKNIRDEKPRYAFLSLRTFLALRREQRLEVIGRIEEAAGGNRYHIVGRTVQTLEACKGKTLVSHHADDVRFIDTIVFGDAAKLSDFKLVAASRPIQAIKKVSGNEAECALIDDGQLGNLLRVDGAGGIRAVWSSATLPSLIVAAFPSAPAADRKRFMEVLSALAETEGQETYKELDFKVVRTASDADVKELIEAYERKS
jgi:hypothetical protein